MTTVTVLLVPHVVDAHTDAGAVKKLNEDFVVVEPGFWAVGDIGSGGFLRDEEVRSIADLVARLARQRLLGQPAPGPAGRADTLREFVIEVHAELIGLIAATWRLKGAGVTLTALWWPDDDDVAHVAQVGDTQAYLVGADHCALLLPAHQLGRLWVRPAPGAPAPSTAAPTPRAVDTLGIANTAPQIDVLSLSPGDQAVVLISDGVHVDGTAAPISVDELAAIVRRDPKPARRLVETSTQRAARDNCTAVIVRRPPAR